MSTAFIFLSEAAQGQMGGSFIRKSRIHCIYFSLTAIRMLFGADLGQFHHEKVMSTAFIFLLRTAQRQIMKILKKIKK